jgi:GH43 family beta-xylosidase
MSEFLSRNNYMVHPKPFLAIHFPLMQIKNFWPVLLLLAVVSGEFGLPVVFATDPPAQGVFTNPVARHGQDPWVIRWNSAYYFCQSRDRGGSNPGGVWVNVATNLEDIGKNHWKCVWHPEPGTPHSEEIWAPELHFLQGKWYIYVAADDGDNSNHRMYVLEGTSSDPQQPFVLKGKITAPTDRWAIDGTVLEMPDGKLYFIWSGWKGLDNVAQDLYIAPMSNPWTINGNRVRISRPEYPWEKNGLPINEGPETLWNGNHAFIIYSASGFWTDDYCLGQLTWTGGDVLDPKSWVKKPVPAFSSTPTVFAPGHCSFVKSPDGKEDWIIYHAHISAGSDRRDVRIQRFTWNPDGSPNFGAPVSPGIPLSRPSGEE